MESKTIRTGVQSKKLYLKCTLHTFWRSKEMNTPGHPLFIVFHERTISKLITPKTGFHKKFYAGGLTMVVNG
jgi:hypothetical protein